MWSTRPALVLVVACTGTGTPDDKSDGSHTVTTSTTTGTTTPTTSTTTGPITIDMSGTMTGQESGRAGWSVAFLGDGRLIVGAPSVPYTPEQAGEFIDDVVYVTEGGDGALPVEVPAIVTDDAWPDTDPDLALNKNGFGFAVVSVGDVTGDGQDDVAVADTPTADRGTGRWSIAPGPTFDVPFLLADWGTGAGAAVACGDVNGDGEPDLCTSEGVVFGPITGGSTLGMSWPAEEGRRVGALDVDGDGSMELAVSDSGTESVYLVEPAAVGAVSLPAVATVTWSTSGDSVTAIATGDLDADGLPELVIGLFDASGAGTVYIGAPAGGGALAGSFATVPVPADALAVGDFDGDGDDDLAVGSGSAVSAWLGPVAAGPVALGTEAATYIGRQNPSDGFGFSLASADADGDGRHDLAIGAPYDNFFDPPPTGASEGYGEQGRVSILGGAGLP